MSTKASVQTKITQYINTKNHKLQHKTANLKSRHWRCTIKKAALKNFSIFTGKQLHWRLFLIKFTLLKKLQRWCFTVNITKF